MKILLIKPPQWGFYLEVERFFPVGLAYLASAARKSGHDVAILDCLTYKEDNRVMPPAELSPGQREKIRKHPSFRHIVRWGASWDRVRDLVRREAPDLVGITIMHTPMYDTAYETARVVRDVCPKAILVAGGAHVSILWNHVLSEPAWDYAILGEGEQSFARLLQCLDDGREAYEVDGCAFHADGGKANYKDPKTGMDLYCNPKREWITDLDGLERPAVDLLNRDAYRGDATLITSRGCPFSCHFCTVHPSVGRKFRARSAENVVDEIEWYLSEWGIRSFDVEDDNFTFDPDRVGRICDLIKGRGLDIEWRVPNGITVMGQSEELVAKMVGSGFSGGFIGLESTSRERLKEIAKGFTGVDKVKTVIGWFGNRGVDVGASLIVGLPTQSLEEMVEDLVNVVKEGLSVTSSNPFYPLPPTESYRFCLEKGYLDESWDYTWYDEYNFPIGTESFTRREVYELWLISLGIHLWSGLFRFPARLHTIEEFVRVVNDEADTGAVELLESGDLEFTLPQGVTFSERLEIKPRDDHASKLFDTMPGDLMAAVAHLMTAKPFRAVQTESILTGHPSACYVLKRDDGSSSRAIDMLGRKLRDEPSVQGREAGGDHR